MTTPSLRSRLSAIGAALRPHLPALAFLALMALAYWHRLDVWHIDDDEEGYLYAAWRISLGELPYRDFLTPQLPAFLFPGGLWIALFGPHAWVLRAWSAILTLVAGWFFYLTGRRLYGAAGGLAALVLVLLSDDIFPLARAWRPEATMLALGACALYTFVRADESGSRRGYFLASLLFGASLLAKLFGFLPWAGVGAYLAFDALTRGRPWRRALGDLAALFLPGLVLVAGVMGGFQLLTGEAYQAVVEHQIRQNATLDRWVVLGRTLDFYWRALSWHAPFLAFLPLGIYGGWKLAGRRSLVVPWVLPTVLAFLLLTRTLFARHLVYLLPYLALLAGAAIAWLKSALSGQSARVQALVAVTLVAVLALPFVFDDLESYQRAEVGTERLGELVRTLAPADTRIVADYPGIAFYGDRATTYAGAGLSEGATESGQITGAKLWDEMQTGNVSLVLIDQSTQNGQLKDLVDFDDWQAKVTAGYRRLGKFYRWYQPLDVYRRNDEPGLGLDFGALAIEDVGGLPPSVEAGATVDLTSVLVAQDKPDKAYTAFLHLIGPDGRTWATGDTFMNNALARGSEEWEPGEVVAVPMSLHIPYGSPPGIYRLQMGLYDAGSGERLGFTAPDGPTGDAREVGTLEVRPPSRPPPQPTGTVLGQTGELQLLAASVPAEVTAGEPIDVVMTWRAAQAPRGDYSLLVEVKDGQGASLGPATLVSPGTSNWRDGELRTIPVDTAVYPEPMPSDEEVDAGLRQAVVTGVWQQKDGSPDPPAVGPALELGRVRILELVPPATPPSIARPVQAEQDHTIAVLGSNLPAAALPGDTIPLELYWRTKALIPRRYTVLLHLVNASGEVVTQADGEPDRPTRGWRPGEVIADKHTLVLPSDLPPGDYTVLTGLYSASDPANSREVFEVDGQRREDGRVPLGVLRVGEQPAP